MPSPTQRCFHSHSLTCLAAACLNTPVKQHILGTKQLLPAEPLLLLFTHYSCLAHGLISSRLIPGKHPCSWMWMMRAKCEDPQSLVRHRTVNAHHFLPFKPLIFYKLIHEPSLNKGTQSPWGKPASNTCAKCKYYKAGRWVVRGLNTRFRFLCCWSTGISLVAVLQPLPSHRGGSRSPPGQCTAPEHTITFPNLSAMCFFW